MLYLRLIILSVGGDVPVDSEALLVTDFVNLNIKPSQSFEDAHRNRVCVPIFIGVSAHTCMSIYVYTVFLKNNYDRNTDTDGPGLMMDHHLIIQKLPSPFSCGFDRAMDLIFCLE
jgi:hypothetical protein